MVVNRSDQILGTGEKLACHRRPETLHRGFAAFILDADNRILLSKRSQKKTLWPLSWDNSCSSHPYLGETYVEAGKRRLFDELGFTTSLSYVYKFRYRADYSDKLAEHEVCAVLVGRYVGKVKPNPDEICAVRWTDFKLLKREIVKDPSVFTPWMMTILDTVSRDSQYRRRFFRKLYGRSEGR